jgi:hypothetical protein
MRCAWVSGGVVLGLVLAGTAAAEGIGTLQALAGGMASGDVDEIEVKAQGQKQTIDGDDEDLESNFGLAATYEFSMSPRITLGPRLAFLTSEGDDSENILRTVDIGGIARFFFNDGQWRAFGAAGLGATYVMLKNDDTDLEGSGIGYHVLVGGGVQGDVSDSVGFVAGLYFNYQGISSIEGDAEIRGIKVDAEYKDAVASRMLLAAGITF